MKITYAILIGIILIFAMYYRVHPLISKLRIGRTIFTVETAVTEKQKQQGLGGRTSLPSNHGMLFPYDHKEQYEFWMKGMNFPLDFIWIDGHTVVDLSRDIPAPNRYESPVIIKPSVPVDKIFEVRAGTIQAYGISIGDTVEYLDR